ncbi:uncharacterized protein [Leuresthes tenuis]|uniref:uncharacterized protein isoform X2 n=1 Tax=Leuresthes tenuis TaxID=355514 RepID=UPI003B50EC5D
MSKYIDRILPGLPPNLHNDEETVAIEKAIRTAIDAVMMVMSGACSRRMLEHQRTVADRDKEIRRLRCKLEESESELRMLRLKVIKVPPEDELSCLVTEEINSGDANSSDNNQLENESLVKYCGAAAPTQISPKLSGIVEAFAPHHAHSDTSSRKTQGRAACAHSGVKEEPSDLEQVIKWEVCEGSLLDQLDEQHEEKPVRKESLAENGAKPRLIATGREDESPAHLKRKGGERNGCYQPTCEVEEGVVKKACITRPLAAKVTAAKDNLGSFSSPEPLRQTSNDLISSNFASQDPRTCQQQEFLSVSAPQPTCDPILLEVLVSLETIKQQNSTVLKILQSGGSSAAPHCDPPDVGALPLQSVQDLRNLEHRLSTEPELIKKLISYLGLSGGMTTKESVWRIMAKLFTNTLAKNVNWRGRNNKQKIESLTIKRVVLNAVRQNSFCKDAVYEEIERYMKRWLQLAGDRDGGRKRRQEKGKDAIGSMRNYCVGEMFADVIE